MRIILVLFAVCMVAGIAAGTSAPAGVATTSALDPQALYKQSLGAVLTLVADKSDGSKAIGSAFMAMREGVAVTAWHVVRGATHVTARTSDGEEFEVSGLIDRDEKRDVAIVRIKAYGRSMLQSDPSEPGVGTRVYAIGAPRGLEFSLSEGLVSQWQVMEGRRLIQYTCATSPGNSGGPLLNARGQVVGVVSAQLREGQNLNFAVPISAALALDASLPTRPWQVLTNEPTNSAALSDEDTDRLLGRALCTVVDTWTALMGTQEHVVKQKGGFRNGVPPYLYRQHDAAMTYVDSLGTLTTADVTRERARRAAKEDLTILTQTADLLMEAVRAAQTAGGWSAEASDRLSRSIAASTKASHSDSSTFFPLMRSSAFRGASSPVAHWRLGLMDDSTGVSLGVDVWSRDDLSIVTVSKGALGDRLGLEPWDRILEVNDETVHGLIACKQALSRLRGQSCALSVMRRGRKVKLPSARLPTVSDRR